MAMSSNNKEDLKTVESLLSKAADAEQRNTDLALDYSKDALSLARKHGLTDQEAHSLMRIGRCYWINGAFDKAINHLNKALQIATELELDEIRAETLIGLGNVNITMEFIDQAVNHYNAALSLSREKDFLFQEAKVLNNLGTLHEDLKNYHKALDYYQLSFNKAKSSNNSYNMAIANLNMGNVYLNLKEYDEAYQHIHDAFEHAKANDKTLMLAHSYFALGQYYHLIKQHEQSIDALHSGIKEAEESNDIYILIQIYLNLAEVYDDSNEAEKAQENLEKAYEMAKGLDVPEFMPRIHEKLASFYENNQLKDKAYQHLKNYLNANKIVQENRRKERIKNTEFQVQLEQSLKATKTYQSLTNELKRNYKQLTILSEIGRRMTATHNIEVIFNQLYKNINRLMRVDSMVVALYNEDKKTIDVDFAIEKNKRNPKMSLELDDKNSLIVHTYKHQKTLHIDNVKEEHKHYLNGTYSNVEAPMLSAIFTPLMVEGETIGVISVQSEFKNVYNETHKVFLETLASYLAIAIKNAKRSKELDILHKKFKTLSEHDGLTGIPNRRLFDQTYKTLWKKFIKNNKPLSMMFIDIDNFKNFNDTYGHLVGDEVIISVAQELQSSLDQDKFLARYGGDEFVILLPETTLKEAKQFADTLIDSLRRIKDSSDIERSITVSIGLATLNPDDKADQEAFLDFVDNNLYISKNSGKNKITASAYKAS